MSKHSHAVDIAVQSSRPAGGAHLPLRWLWVLAALVILGGCAGPAPTDDPGVPAVSGDRSGAGAAEDLRAAAAFLESVHPAPYRFIDAQDFQAVVDREARALAELEAPDDLRIGRAFHRVFAQLGDFHIKVSLPLYGDRTAPVSLLPVLPKRAGDQVFVDAAAEAFPAGTELTHIDGRTIDELYDELAALVLRDGQNEVAARRELERDFPRYYHLAYGMSPRYEVGVVLPDGSEEQVRVLDGLGREDFSKLRTSRRSAPVWGPQPDGATLPFRVSTEPSVAYLRVPTFGVGDQEAFINAVDEFFASLEDEETLIIDLRGNEGGLRTLGFPILGRLIDRPYRQWKRFSARVKLVPERHRDRVIFPFAPDTRGLAPRFGEPDEHGRYVHEGDPLADHMTPIEQADAHQFERVVVFVDGLTNSAANTFVLALVANRDDVVVVGEEIGGECGEHVGEFPLVYVTPNYGIHMMMSLIHIEHIDVAGCAQGHGLRPDVEVRYEADDFLQGNDPYLDARPSDGL